MKEILLNCVRYSLIGVAAILVVLLTFGYVLMMRWPSWVAVCVLLVLACLVLGALFAKKVMVRKKDQEPVQEVVEQGQARFQKSSPQQAHLQELQHAWREAMAILRHCHLKKQGNPLYVLPWYLVLGASGSGKTTAIKGSGLSSPFAESTPTGGGTPTLNCDWWFFDHAVLLDTAGRYTMPASEPDNEEWHKFLSLLVKSRKRAPIDGLIVTVAADRLVTTSHGELEKDGLQVRRRMDELMHVLGTKFPVYTLVTKCDLIPGMTEFAGRLPETVVEQAVGVVNEGVSTDLDGYLKRFGSLLSDRLKRLRLLLLNEPDAPPAGAPFLLFPDELDHLRAHLEIYLKAAFHDNPYQDTPLLRGIYLSSGRQEGALSNASGAEQGPVGKHEVGTGTSRGLYLHDFFDKVLPRDRWLAAPTSRSMLWRGVTRNVGLASWGVAGLGLCGLLTLSFLKNAATIREASAVIDQTPELNRDFPTDLASLDRFQEMIAAVERKNRDWWTPRFGLKESLKVEAALKGRYCRLFRDRFLLSLDRSMSEAIASFSLSTPDDLSGSYVIHLSRRMNLLQARLAGAGLDQLKAKPLPSYPVAQLQQGDEPGATGKLGDLYLHYLVWRSGKPELEKEVQAMHSLLKQLSLVKGANLAWLLDFVNAPEGASARTQAPGAAITLASFWGGSRNLASEPVIAPAFTRKGRERVTALVNELAAAYPGPGMERERIRFEKWYRSSCFAAWQRFADLFPKGQERLVGAKEWQRVAEIMGSEQGPYLGFMKRAVAELEAFGISDGVPPWIAQLYRYQALKNAPPAAGATAAAIPGRTLPEKPGRLPGREGAALASLEPQASAARTVQEYLGALAQVAPVAKSRNLAYQMAQQVFSEDAALSKSPLYLAADAAQRLNSALTPGRGDDTFARLISSPITFYGTYVRMETACSLQRQWEEKVLKEVQGAGDPQTLQYLLGKEGPVWKFVSASADPFMGWTPGRGYYSKSALGGSIPFQAGFYAFLAKGAKAKVAQAAADAAPRQNYNLTLKGLPTDANVEAKIKPQRTRLELQCPAGPQTMENLNYPVTRTFVWSPECGEVIFRMEVGDLLLSKRYRGLPDFLHDFPGGRHTFGPRDFPREKDALGRMGISFIRPVYQIFGGEGIASAGAAAGKGLPAQVPAKITECWD